MKVTATSFADLKDLEAFKKCKAAGGTDQECFKKGDNGIGFTGLVCATEKRNYCALPKDVWKAKWGTKKNASGRGVKVTYKGKTVLGKLGDTLPATEDITNGAGIDLNPGFAKEFGLKPPFKVAGVEWEWTEA